MADNFVKYGSRGIDEGRNRAYDTRRDDDIFKTPSITLYDIDFSILWFLKNKIIPKIEENGKMINVPVYMAAGEKWAQIQRNGYIRDKSRKVMSPIITLKRNSMTADTSVPKLDVPADNRGTQLIIFPDQQLNNTNDWIHKTELSKKSKTYFLSVLPDHVLVSYDIHIWTDLTTQMNTIVEQVLPHDRMPWGDIMQFTTRVSDYSFETINNSGEDRLVRCSIPITVSGLLQNEYEGDVASIRKAHSIKRVDFMNEIEQEEIYPDHMPRIINSARSRIPTKKFDENP